MNIWEYVLLIICYLVLLPIVADIMTHAPDCPITLHRQLVAKYGGEK